MAAEGLVRLATIELLGQLCIIAGKELCDSLGSCKSLREILSSLLAVLRDNPDFGQPVLVEDLQRYLIVLVNGSVADKSIMDMELGAIDRVVILPLSHGG